MSTLKPTKLVLLYKLQATNLTNVTRLPRNPVGVLLGVSINLKSSFNLFVIAWSSRLEGRMVDLMKGHCISRRILTKRSWGLLRVSRHWISIWMSSLSRQNKFGRNRWRSLWTKVFFFLIFKVWLVKNCLRVSIKWPNAISDSDIVFKEELQKFCSETPVSNDCCEK